MQYDAVVEVCDMYPSPFMNLTVAVRYAMAIELAQLLEQVK